MYVLAEAGSVVLKFELGRGLFINCSEDFNEHRFMNVCHTQRRGF